REKVAKQGLSPDDEMALRRYSSYKLRVPRCLTCFSALSYLLSLTPSEPAHVEKDDIVRMVGMTPIDRLQQLRSSDGAPRSTLDELERLYVRFLERTDGGKTALTDELKENQDAVLAISQDGRNFTRHMFNLIQAIE